MEAIVLALRIILLIIFYLLEGYVGLICLFFFLSWFPRLRFTKFYSIMERIAYPFMRIFSGRIVIGSFDLSATLGLIVIEYLLTWFYRLIFLI